MLKNYALVTLWVAASSWAGVAQASNKCPANNLLRCFIATPSLATPYCSSFLDIPAVTVTVTSTGYTVQTTIVSTVSTETDVLTSTTTSTSYSTATSTTTLTAYSTSTASTTYVAVEKRTHTKAVPTSLACLTNVNPESSLASISSACQCLSITPVVVSVTSTATTVTETSLLKVTASTSTTTLLKVTTVIPTTTIKSAHVTDITTTTITTTTSSSTSSHTSPILPGPPGCSPGVEVDGFEWYLFFAGAGVQEPTNNPASNGRSPYLATFPGSFDDCSAIVACINAGFESFSMAQTFDVHYVISQDMWFCNGYALADSTSYFTQTSPQIGAAYGYSIFRNE